MPDFSFRGVSPEGNIVANTISATSLEEAKALIRGRGIRPIEILPLSGKNPGATSGVKPIPQPISPLGRRFRKKETVKLEVLVHFCRQLSVIMDSGINTLRGLEILKNQVRDPAFKGEIARLASSVERGLTISEAMEEPDSMFPPILAGMVKAGESTGKIDVVLRSMADYYEKEHLLQRKTRSAAVYPSIILVMALGLVLFFINYLLPLVVNVIEGSGGELFFLTRFILGISLVLRTHYLLILLTLALLVAGSRWFFAREKGKRILDRFIFSIPLLGEVRKNIVSLRFSMAMYVFTISGFSILQGLELLKNIVGSPLAVDNIDSTIRGLQRGETISENLRRNQFFDDILIQMVTIGEETGQMQKLTQKLVDFYEKEVDMGVSRIISFSEPVLMLVIGTIVGILIISVALPMLTIFTNI